MYDGKECIPYQDDMAVHGKMFDETYELTDFGMALRSMSRFVASGFSLAVWCPGG